MSLTDSVSEQTGNVLGGYFALLSSLVSVQVSCIDASHLQVCTLKVDKVDGLNHGSGTPESNLSLERGLKHFSTTSKLISVCQIQLLTAGRYVENSLSPLISVS